MNSFKILMVVYGFTSFSARAAMPPVPVPAPAPAPVTTLASGVSTSAMESLLNEDMIHILRDPFQMPSILATKKAAPRSDLELFELKDFKLNGVVTGPKKTRAMVSAPNGKTYFVATGDLMGLHEGKVTAIQSDAIKVVEYQIDEKGKKIPEVFEVRINGEVVSLSTKEE